MDWTDHKFCLLWHCFSISCLRVSPVPLVLLVLLVPMARRWVFSYHWVLPYSRLLFRNIQMHLSALLSEAAAHRSVWVADIPVSSYRVNLVPLVLLELPVPAVLPYVSQFYQYCCSQIKNMNIAEGKSIHQQVFLNEELLISFFKTIY